MSDIFGKITIDSDQPGSTPKKQQKSPHTPTERKEQRSRRSLPKALSWLLVCLGLFFAYCIIGFVGVPYYINHFIPQQIRQNYNLNLRPGKVTFNPFTFTLTARLAELTEPGGKPLVSLNSLELTFAPIQILRMDFVCTRVNISKPSLHLVRYADDSYNFSSLIPNLSAKDDNSGMLGFSDLPFSFSLNNISVTDGDLVFDDKPANKTHTIQQLDLRLPTLSNTAFEANSYITPHFSAIVNGNPLTFKGEDSSSVTPQSRAITQLSWQLKNVVLQNYINYLPFNLPFSINKGTVNGILDLKFNSRENLEDKLTITFDLTLTDIDCETQQQKLLLTSPTMHVAGSFVPVKKIFTITSLKLESPEFTAKSQDIALEISRMFFVDTDKPKKPAPIKRPVIFALHFLQFTNGTLKQPTDTSGGTTSSEWAGLDFKISNYVSHQSYRLADNKPSMLQISGHTKDDTNIVTYFGAFTTPSVISGELSIDKITAPLFLSLMLPDDTSLNAKGRGKLSAHLTISKDSDSEQLNFSLAKIKAHISDLTIYDKSEPYIQAEEVLFSAGKRSGNTTDLGDITVKNGQIFYHISSPTNLFSKIGSGEYNVSSLDYRGRITVYTHRKNVPPFTLANTVCKYANNGSAEEATKTLEISGIAARQGTINASGTVHLNPFKIDVLTTFERLNTVETAALFPQHSFLTTVAGKLSGKGRFTFPQTAFSGDIKVSDGHFIRSDNQTISWDTFELEDINYTTNPYRVAVDQIHINKLQLGASIQPGQGSIPDHFFNLLRGTLASAQHGPVMKIQTLSITNGNATISDYRLSPPWIGKVGGLNGEITDIHPANSASNSSFIFTGHLDGAAFRWTGTIDPTSKSNTDKNKLELTNYPLTHFSDQLHPVSDLNVTSATIDLSLTSEEVAGEQHHLLRSTLSQVKANSADSVSALPLALLCNKNGVLEMNFSTSESAFQPNTSLFDTFMSNFQKRTLKASLSPLLLTNGEFSDLIDNEFIAFNPGEFILSAKGRKTLNRYSALLIAHPNIKLSLSGGIYPGPDREGLYRQLEINETLRVERRNEKLFAKWQDKKEEYEAQVSNNQNNALLEGGISENDIPAKVLAGFRPLIPEPVVVDNEMLFDLAEERLEIVKRHITTQLSLAKGRIVIVQPALKERENNPYAKGVQVEIMPFK